jgi:ABC-type dipeptide transport system, periplasmic component
MQGHPYAQIKLYIRLAGRENENAVFVFVQAVNDKLENLFCERCKRISHIGIPFAHINAGLHNPRVCLKAYGGKVNVLNNGKEIFKQALANPYPVDLEKARSLLKQASYGEGGKKLVLEITVPSIYTMHVDTAQVIAEQLAKVGINVSIRLVDWAAWLSDVYFGRKYQATIISLDSPNVSPRSFLSRYRSDNNGNFINYSSAAFDRVFDAILVETSEEKRIALYKEAQRIISADAASVYIQDILGFRALRAGAYGGVLNYPLYVNDFAAMYVK